MEFRTMVTHSYPKECQAAALEVTWRGKGQVLSHLPS